MMSVLPPVEGRAWLLGDGIDTDSLAPGTYIKLPPGQLACHCLEWVRPDFASGVQPGDVIIAGESFGIGSSREHAAVSLKLLGVGAVVARSFSRIFLRNAINVGLPAITAPAGLAVEDGNRVRLDFSGTLHDLTSGRDHPVTALPARLEAIVTAGGLLPYLKRRNGAVS